MVLPLIPLAIGAASLVTGALGLKKGFDAKKTLEEAREIGDFAQQRYKKAIRNLDDKRESVNAELTALGEYKKETFKEILGYVVKQVKNAKSSAEGIDEHISSINAKEIDIFNQELTKISVLEIGNGMTQGFGAGTAGAFGAYGTVGLLASASTGTAISSLSGAAATNATLAWLGGGSLATGGLGVVGGTWVLGGLVAGPALAIAGYALASKAEEALTKAEEYKAEVDVAVAELDAPKALLAAIQANIDDTKYVIGDLVKRFSTVRDDFESHLLNEKGWRKMYAKFRGKRYQQRILQIKEEKLGRLIVFGTTLKAVISEPLLDNSGAAALGFNTKITGIVKIDHIDTRLKTCAGCDEKIAYLARTCPKCNAIQPALIEEVSRKKTPTAGFIISIGSVATIAAFSTYFWVERVHQKTPPVSQTPTVASVAPALYASVQEPPATKIEAPVVQAESVAHPQAQEQSAQQQTVQAPAVASLNLLDRAAKCMDIKECIAVMLQSIDPRTPEALQVAAARIAELNKTQRGDRKEARKLNEMGLAEFKKKDYGSAMNLLKQANVADPADVEILSNLGYVALQANQINEAVTALAEALLLDPRRTSTWTPIAEIYAIRDKNESAVRALLLGYEFSGNKDKTVSVYEAQSIMTERESMKSIYIDALKKITALRGN